jgi:hypothetical protein
VRIRTVKVLKRSRLGFRGAILLGLAFIDIVYGLTLALPSHETRDGSAYAWRQEFLPTEVWGIIWIAVGVFLITQGWARRDRAAYAVAVSIKLLWMTVALGSWLLGPVPASQALAICGIFAAFAFIAFVCSLWPEPITSRTVTTMSEDHDSRGADDARN